MQFGTAVVVYSELLMPFVYHRTIRFQDTDAAGVIYFANVLSICHEAYEASLSAADIDLRTFFSNPDVAIPITQANVNFFRPMFCGDRIAIYVTPRQISADEFAIDYEILAADIPNFDITQSSGPHLAKAFTQHVCIAPSSRTRQSLPGDISRWLSRWSVAGAMS